VQVDLRAEVAPVTAHQQNRRRHGSGGIFRVSSGVWRVDVEISRDPVTGRRRRLSRQVRGTKADAEVALAQLKVADATGRTRRRGTKARTVQAALDAYIDDAERGDVVLAKRTIITSRSARTTLSGPVLAAGRPVGDNSLDRLGWEEIEDLYRSMAVAGAGVPWIRRCATVLTNALERARKHGVIDENPAKDADRPKLIRTKPRSPSEGELRTLLASVVEIDPELGDALRVMAGTGVRMGELLGLQWPEIDLAVAEMHVAWAVSDGGPGVGVFRKETKQSDWRDVPLTRTVTAALRRQRERLQETYGVEPGADHYVFPGLGIDRPHRPDSFGDRFAAARGTSEMTFLHVRHYVATTMLDAGEECRTVADLLGNSEVTLRLHYDGRTNVGKRRAISASRCSEATSAKVINGHGPRHRDRAALHQRHRGRPPPRHLPQHAYDQGNLGRRDRRRQGSPRHPPRPAPPGVSIGADDAHPGVFRGGAERPQSVMIRAAR
jgi:integrase